MRELPELPGKFQSAFLVSRTAAEQDYSGRVDKFPHNPRFAEFFAHLPLLIQKVFFAYCAQARESCRAGFWTPAQMQESIDAAWAPICQFFASRENPEWSDAQTEAFGKKLWPSMTLDQQWRQHLSEQKRLAEGHAGQSETISTNDSDTSSASHGPDSTSLQNEDVTPSGSGGPHESRDGGASDKVTTPSGVFFLEAPIFRYRYADDFPAENQVDIEHARLAGNAALERIPYSKYSERKEIKKEWFWQIMTAGADAIGRAGAAQRWGSDRRRDELCNFGRELARAGELIGKSPHQFGQILRSRKWQGLDDLLFPRSVNSDMAGQVLHTAAAKPSSENNSSIAPNWASDLTTIHGRQAARMGWKRHWSTPNRECTNADLTLTAYEQDDRAFLNQWENGKTRLKNPEASSRVQAIEEVLRNNSPPQWHPAAKRSRR
jgi:hypothetical protein